MEFRINDANNNVLTVTLHNGAFGDQATAYAFDEFDRKTQETLPAIGDGQTRRTLWAYYQNGAVATVTDAKNQTTENEYDLDNRLTLLRLKQTGGTVAETRTFTYNKADKPLAITDAAGTTTNTYDALYRLLTETRVNATNDAYTVQNFYDQAGNRTKVIYPGTSRVLLSQYDALSRLSQIVDGSSTNTYGYDANGNRVFLGLPNGQTTTNQFDALNRVTSMVNQAGGSNVYTVAYAYDLIGNRLSAIEDLATQGIRTNSYVYDDQYRLTEEHSTLSTQLASSVTYSFDPAGNRLSLIKIVGDSTNVTMYAYDVLIGC